MENTRIQELLAKQEGKCAECQEPLTTIENEQPDNTRILCSSCIGCYSVTQEENDANSEQSLETPQKPETDTKRENNRITPPRTENKKTTLPFKDVYQWANLLTSESTQFEFDFIWTPPMKRLLRKLNHLEKQLVVVIGLQGVGKTEFLKQLEWKLRELREQSHDEKRVISINLANFDPAKAFLTLDDQHALTWELEREYRRLFPTQYHEGGKGRPDAIEKSDITTEFNWYRRKLGRRANKIIEDYVLNELGEAKCIFVDLGDYDKRNRSRMNGDLIQLRNLWVKITCPEDAEPTVNFIFSMQKELFTGNFLFGKPMIFELKPFSPRQLVEFYKQKFGSTAPFTEDALFRVAQLSMGIWRRYKKYISTSLDEWYDLENSSYSVTLQDVEQWITIEQLAKDMELEFSDIFPHNKPKQRKAMMVCQRLQKGAMKQFEIAKEFFGEGKASEMACSRMLEVLETHDKISRSLEGTRNMKVVSLKGGEQA